MGTRIPSVRDAAQPGRTGGFRLHGQSRHPVPPRTNVLLVATRSLSHGHEKGVPLRRLRFQPFAGSRMRAFAGNKVHRPDSSFSAAISRFRRYLHFVKHGKSHTYISVIRSCSVSFEFPVINQQKELDCDFVHHWHGNC